MDFVTGLPLSADWKGDSYNSILVIVNWLTKMVYYQPVKVTIDAPGPAEVISDVISRHHNDFLASHFGINKTKELVGQKYYCPSLRKDIETYVRGCNICLALKAIRHKPYGDLQSLPIPTYQ